MVSAIGRQQTVQSSISDCSRSEVSTCNGNTSPQCGQAMSVSIVRSIGKNCARLTLAVDQPASSLSTIHFPILAETMDFTYGIFGSTDAPAFWPAYFSGQKQKAPKQGAVSGKQAADQSKGCILVV